MKTKKLISILITLAMVVGLLPTMSLNAFAAEEYGEVITGNRKSDNAIKDVTIDGSSGFSKAAYKIEPTAVGAVVEFVNVTFKNIHTGWYGDCVYINNNSDVGLTVNFTNCKFINCGKSGKSYGGAVYVYSKNNNATDVNFKNCVAINCKGDRGGFLYCNNANATIDGTGTTAICGCEATYGGAVYMNYCNEVKGFTFASNKAHDGGAIYDYCQEDSNGLISGCCFAYNTATNQGGAIFYDNNQNIFGNTYYNNNDASGFDIYMKDSLNIRYIDSSTFYSDNETAEWLGSHIGGEYNLSSQNPNSVVLTSKLEIESKEDGKYHINNNDDWFAFYCMVKNGSNFENKTVVLDNDIAVTNPIGIWTGNSNTERLFKGTFDGNGKTVSLYMPIAKDNNAAFEFTVGATIENLTTDGYVKGNSGAGGIVSHAENTTLENCINYAEIVGNSYVGGICGYSKNTKIYNCINCGSVSGTNDIIGGITGKSLENSEYENCFYDKEKAPADSHGTGLSTKAMTGIEEDNGYIMPDCANDYITQNEKDKDGFCYIAFDKDGKLYFVKNNGHYHTYKTEYIWSDDNTTCTATRYCKDCQEGTLGHLQKKETAAAANAEHHPATCTEHEYTVYTTESFKDSDFAVQTKTVDGEPAKGHDCIVEIKYNEDEKQYSLYEKCNNCDHEKTYTNDFSGYIKADCINVSGGAYINTGYNPNANTHVAMDVNVNGSKEYWFGAWDIDYKTGAFALGNDVSGVYAGFMTVGDTYGGGAVQPNIRTRVELDRNRVIIGGNERKLTDTQYSYTLYHSLYLFTQNRAGTPYFDKNDNQKFTCYGCEIYESGIVKHYYIPCIRPNGLAGLYDLVEGKFYSNANTFGSIKADFTTYLPENPKVSATCITPGHETYYVYEGKFYEDSEHTKEIADLTKWSGYYPALGHDFEITDTTHKCRRCGLNENHIDENNDRLCDFCRYDFIENIFDTPYLDKTLNDDNTVTTTPAVCSRARKITADDTVWGVAGETVWYVADNTLSLKNRPEVKGDVRIILKDGATLTANHGITVEEVDSDTVNSLTIYSQSDDKDNMGRLTVSTDENSGNAAIGGRKGSNAEGHDNSTGNGYGGAGGNNCGKVWLCGGKIVVTSDGVCIGGGNGGRGANGTYTYSLDDFLNFWAGGNGGDGGSFDSVYFCGGEVSLESASGACVGGGNGGNGGAGYSSLSRNGSRGNIGANGTVYFYGGTQTFLSTEKPCFNANSDGSYSFLKLFGTPELKAGDNATSAVTTDGYDGQKYFSVLYKEANKLSLKVDGNTFTVTPSGENAENGVVFVGLYDKERSGRLLDVKKFDIKTQNPTGTFDTDGYVKAFWWNNMTPLCEAVGDSCVTIAQYTVSFNMMGHGTGIPDQTVRTGEKVQKPTDPPAEGYIFGGWYKDENFQYAWNFDTDTVMADTALYAKWTKSYEATYVVSLWGVDEKGVATFGPATTDAGSTPQGKECDRDHCIHKDSWNEIRHNIQEGHADYYGNCITNHCTKEIPLVLNDTIASGGKDAYAPSTVLYDSIKADYRRYNYSYDSSDCESANWATSRIRATLNGCDSFTPSVYAGTDCLTAKNCLLSCFPKELQNMIVPREFTVPTQWSTSSPYKITATMTVTDKLWLPNADELYSSPAAQYKDYGVLYPVFSGKSDAFHKAYNESGSANAWWLRSPCRAYGVYVANVSNSGYLVSNPLSYTNLGLAPCFCIR